MKDEHINSWLSSCGSGLSLGVPTKVKAHKSFLFTEYSLKGIKEILRHNNNQL